MEQQRYPARITLPIFPDVLSTMRTIGEILKKVRLENNLEYEEIERKLRIRKKFLIALEDNSWSDLPAPTYIKGFIRNYSSFLGLNPEEMVAIFRRQYINNTSNELIPEGITTPLNEPSVRITPQMTIITASVILLVILFLYLFSQYSAYTGFPMLEINEPLEGETKYSENIVITGKTDPDAVISINNQKIVIDNEGKFSINLELTPGINNIVIEATGKNGKTKTITRSIQIQTAQ